MSRYLRLSDIGVRLITIAIVILVNGACRGQTSVDARSRAIGGIRTLPMDSWATCHNPAGLSTSMGLQIGLAGLNRYLLKELKDISFSLRFNVKDNGLGIAGKVSGFRSLLRQTYFLSYGRNFNEKLMAGIGLIYGNLSISNYGFSYHTATFKLGTSYLLAKNLQFSFYAINPFGISITNHKDLQIPSTYIAGLTYHISKNMFLSTELESNTEFDFILKGGMEYYLLQTFYLRFGALSHPLRITSGAGIHYSNFLMDISAEYHSYLGFSPGISIIYNSKKPHDEKRQ
jgi:hypothetical protein